METKYTIYEKEDGVATITINRPEALNALNREVILELMRELEDAENDPNVRVVVVTGAGEKAFSAGADVKALAELNPLEARELSQLGHELCRRIEGLGKPVIAAINGYALGGGLELAMACDIRIASENARFGQPEVNLGLLPGWGGTQRLPRLVGAGIAKELIFTGKIIDARTAERIGLVNAVIPPERFRSEVRKLASEIAGKPPIALKLAKDLINRGLNASLESALAHEAEAFGLVASTEDFREGTRAFLEKRKPKFKGR